MGKNKLNGPDYLLLLLYLYNKKPIKGAVRLEKMMFLFNKEISKALKSKGLDSDNLPEFVAYNFGPFAKDIYEQIELFRGLGFIKVSNIYTQEDMGEVDDWEESSFIDELWNDDEDSRNIDNKYMKYEIAAKGIGFIESEIMPLINEEHRSILELFKQKIVKTPVKQLLKYVYSNYPEFTTNSLIKDEVLESE